MTQGRNGDGPMQRFCIVGCGNHARTKLIPALLANGQEIAGLVTSRQSPDLPPSPVFIRLEDAIAHLPSETAFVIATPPLLHFRQAMTVLRAGRDVIIEKPAFVSSREAAEAVAQAGPRLLIEAFMHRHTRAFDRLRSLWDVQWSRIAAIEMSFLVPELPGNTFRQHADVEC